MKDLDISNFPTPWTLSMVVRHGPYDKFGPDKAFDLMRAYADIEDAEQEAARLNSVARPGVTYFVKILHQRTR